MRAALRRDSEVREPYYEARRGPMTVDHGLKVKSSLGSSYQ